MSDVKMSRMPSSHAKAGKWIVFKEVDKTTWYLLKNATWNQTLLDIFEDVYFDGYFDAPAEAMAVALTAGVKEIDIVGDDRDPICDFCGEPATWRLLAFNANMGPGMTSVGDWAACETCHEHVDNRAWVRLARRIELSMNTKFMEIPRAVLKTAASDAVEAFRRSWTGMSEKLETKK